MGEAIDHPAANITYGAPRGEEDRVGALKAYVTTDPTGEYVTSVTTYWQFSDAEIEEIARTKCVMMNVLGGGLPAHFIAPEKMMRPFVADFGKTW